MTTTHLHIEQVSISNDHLAEAGIEVDALAAISYDNEHTGVHYVVVGIDDAARHYLLDIIDDSGFPYEVVS